ncbi:hypothetical protein ACFIOY_27600 [Bradyrhizobium sp. TZ2]
MEFRMSDIPISDPRVGESVARCLIECDRAINVTLTDCKGLMSEQDWQGLRRGFGHVVGGEMLEMWSALVKHHPKFNAQAFGN